MPGHKALYARAARKLARSANKEHTDSGMGGTVYTFINGLFQQLGEKLAMLDLLETLYFNLCHGALKWNSLR